jgi:hypothetical protein
MYHNLTLQVRSLIIEELKAHWADHPRYPEMSHNIQGKYSFEQRPLFGMVVKTSGMSNVPLNAQNYIGEVQGYCLVAQTGGSNKTSSIEWVREHPLPSRQGEEGIYILDITETNPTARTFIVNMVQYKKRKETSLVFTSPTTIELLGTPVENTIKIIEYPSRMSFTDYTISGETITLNEPLPKGITLEINYVEYITDFEPYEVRPDYTYSELIPGVLIHFGRNLNDGDQQAVIVYEERKPVYKEYGGRFDVSVDIDIIARDVHSQADISDHMMVWIWGVLRDKLTSWGLHMNEVSYGGESEEAYDENGDDYFYNSSVSFTLQTDWFIHVPIIETFKTIKSINLIPVEVLPTTDPLLTVGNDYLKQRIR